jgi:NitT/TauT family transport system ATP-binding protein
MTAADVVDQGVPSSAPAVQIRGVDMVFNAGRPNQVHALDGIDLEITTGEFVSLIGPSGCGKSTLLRLVGDLLGPTAGDVTVHGKPARQARLDHDYGMAFQHAGLFDWRTVIRNVELPLELRGWSKSKRSARAKEMLDLVKLGDFADHRPWELSGGMQQRVAICRALVHDPSLLLMDEPFGALDAMTRETMNLELQRIWLATKKTVLFVTHSIPEAVFLSDRVLVMTERPGTVDKIYDIPLPRPRSLQNMGTPEFSTLAQAIRGHFFAQGTVDH